MAELFWIILLVIIAVILVLSERCPKGGRHDDFDGQIVRWSLWEFTCKKCGKKRRVVIW